MDHDVVIVGGGPAGASCAAFCAAAGLRVLVLERAVFPRDKVCGDCLNPDAWPILARLGLEDAVRALPHVALLAVEFVGLRGGPIRLPLPDTPRGEIAVKRRDLDALLLENAAARGAIVRHERAVTGARRTDQGFALDLTGPKNGFHLRAGSGCSHGAPLPCLEGGRSPARQRSAVATDGGRTLDHDEDETHPPTVTGRFLVAADGRNSVVTASTGMRGESTATPACRKGARRIGLQAHVPCPPGFGPTVQMRWFPQGYGGLCPVGGGELNVSLAGPPETLESLVQWARAEFSLAADHPWRTIAPLDRPPAVRAASEDGGVFLVGDAARVVEPFTGEGIYYALRSGELAAESIVAAARGEQSPADAAARYREAHGAMYRGRLWVNRLARAAGRHPRLASWALEALRWQPGLLRHLTAKVVTAERTQRQVF